MPRVPIRRCCRGALEVAGIEGARATLAESGGVFGFFSGTRRAAQAVAAAVARDTENPMPRWMPPWWGSGRARR